MFVLQPAYRVLHWLRLIEADIPERGMLRVPRCVPPGHPVGSTDDCTPKPGATAPDFTLARIGGGNCSLSDYLGRRVLLVFIDVRGRRRHDIAPELNRLHRSRKLVVIVIAQGTRRDAALWADEMLAEFPVLVSSDSAVATTYNVSDAHCAFQIDEQGQVVESGIITPRRRAGYRQGSIRCGRISVVSAT